jgi:hypothetical protein
LVGCHVVVVVPLGEFEPVEADAVVVVLAFFEEPLPFAVVVVVVDLGALAFEPPA